MRVRLSLAVLGCALLASRVALAQAPPGNFDLERFTFNPGATASLVARTGDGMAERGLWLSLAGDYENQPILALRPDGSRAAAVVGDRFTTHVLAAWSPLPRLDVALQLPVVVTQGGDLGATPSSGVGTTYLSGRWLLAQQRWGAPVDFSTQLAVGLPFGSPAAFTSDGAPQALPSVGLGHSLDWVRIGAELGGLLRAHRTYGASAVGSEVIGALSLTTLTRWVRGEVTGRVGVPAFAGGTPAVDVLGAVRVPLPRWIEIYGLAGAGAGHALGNPDYRIVAGVSWRVALDNRTTALGSLGGSHGY